MEDEGVDDSPTSPTMPSIYKADAISLDIRLFEPSALSVDGLAKAQIRLKSVLYTYPSVAVETLLSRPNLFEYIFSVLDAPDSLTLTNYLVDSFPSSAKDFHNSLSSKVLHRIAQFIFLLPYDSEDVVKPAYSSQYFAKVQAGIRALEALQTFSFADKAGFKEQEEEEIQFVVNRKKMSQKQRRFRATRKSVSFDATNLKVFDEEVPYSQEEADLLAKKILSELWLIYQSYLANLRSPTLARLISGQYIITKKVNDVEVELVRESEPVPEPEVVTSAVAESQTSSPAFPNVQPLRASLYFDSAQGFGDWRIFISTRAEKHLREHRKNMPTFKIIIKKIKELSRGHFSFDNQKRLSGPDRGIPIFEAKLTGDLRLIYQVDCISDYGSDVERQALKVYGIFTHAQMNQHLWDYLSTHLESKGFEYRRRVTHRKKPEVTGDNVFRPESWPPEKNEADDEHSAIAIRSDANALQDIHQWLVLEKYVALSQTLLTCILADQEVSHVFNVSPYEREIIEHDSSCYVLGRSGTGKTTTMLFKIFGIERAAKAQLRQNVITSAPRQLFVTQSRVLAGRVEDYYKKLSDFLQTAYMSNEELVKRHRSRKIDDDDDGDLVDVDEEEWHEDLPKCFSDLEDRHFPLFLTFDKLCKMLEADLELSFARELYTKEHKRAQKRFKISNVSVDDDLADEGGNEEGAGISSDTALSPTTVAAKDIEITSSLVTYEIFQRDYWPHLPQILTKTLDPALVFSEIMGVIKGSEQSLSTEKGFLSRAEYVELSHRTQSTFATSRVEVYDLFEAYQKRKYLQRDYDAADRTHAIIRELRRSSLSSQKVDFLYVDEAQDNLLIDAHLLRLLCSNSHGLFWAGDTAQTIAIGSAFRFNDLKAFLHRVEEMVEVNPVKPSSFQLTMNYRSHGGIVSCADSVIQLITKFWPYSIDILRPERGAVEGSKPVFFVGWEENTLRYEQFLFGDSGNAVEFGAQQCILVRNDYARDQLRKQVGEIGVILTLYESKGLEFDDVLLFNFFEDSTCDASQWRIVLNAVDPDAIQGQSVPQFNDLRHAGICTELKFLYVAMTRARKNLWIVDKSDKGSAMRTFFDSKNLVELCTPDKTPSLAVSSSPDEWDKMGRSLFVNKQYHQAVHCFDRACLPIEKGIAQAYYLRQQARALDKSTLKRLPIRKEAFINAAEAFIKCAQARYRESYWRNAGECFVEAENPRRAAAAYFEAKLYTDAVKQFKKAGSYDEAVHVVQEKGEFVDKTVAENIIDVSRLHYLKVGELEKVIALFETEDERMEFIEDFGTNTTRAELLEKLGRYEDAAEMNVTEGLIDDAVRLFLLAKTSSASNRAIGCVLDRLWVVFSFGANMCRKEEATSLLELCKKFDGAHLLPLLVDQVSMFSAINNFDPYALVPLAQRFNTQHAHKAATIFCLDQWIQHLQKSDMESSERTSRTLSAFLLFVELTRSHIWNNKDCLEDDSIRKLLGVYRHPERGDLFVLVEDSMLSNFWLKSRRFDTSLQVGVGMDQDSVMQLIRRAVPSYMAEVAQAVNRVCERSRAFITPCLNHAANGSCFLPGCEREHVNPLRIQDDWFMDRLNIHLQMVACLQAVDFALELEDRETLHRKWLERISQLMFPARHTLGNAGIASSRCSQEQFRVLAIVQTWVLERAFSLDPNRAFKYFLDAVSQMLNFSFWFNKVSTNEFIWRVPFLSDAKYRISLGLSEGTFYSPPNLVSVIGLTNMGSILQGVVFLRFMLEPRKRFPMSVFHFTELVELLCGSVAVLNSFQRSGLHGLMLPKSWILVLCQKIDLGMPYVFNYQRDILDVAGRLMAMLLKPDSSSDFSPFESIPFAVKTICVNRLCRSVVLLGYNIPDEVYRYQVVHLLRRMKSLQKHIPQLNKEFFDKTIDWKRLSTSVRKTVAGSYLDEMVQLHRTGERQLASFDGVCQVTIQGPNDVLAALTQGQRASTLSATAAPFVPQSILSKDDGDGGLESALSQEDQLPDDAEEEDVNEAVLPTESNDVGATEAHEMSKEDMAPVVTLQATDEELKAVARIQAAYKSYKSKRQLETKDSAHFKRIRKHFSTCLQSTSNSDAEWPSRYQKMFFLGVFPHIFVCIDQVYEQATAGKKKANRQLNQANDHTTDYDSFLQRIHKFTKIQRGAIEMKKELRPSIVSATLRKESPFDFRKVVEDLHALAQALVGIGRAEEDLKLATKAVSQAARHSAPKPSKPNLNVDDIDNF
ncbi:hypothetical protein SCHPADRAFT_897689 [Schizopora paradoxa]|uniref:UvrD-like helicase ATP-binding domain-containing protein n=1 Tax=Schizopora paradoxa TaxID=27342 RepID=A0A0H2S820_9AGAM|nr:hypothetical protein SCHPADRAFT_897689 [Schizopora paradoxa]